MFKFGEDVTAVARGHPAADALKQAVKANRDTPLDEATGEGFHRTTSVAKT